MARSLCLLIFLIKFALGSEEFIFWAKVNTQNHIVSSEEISFSQAMTQSRKTQTRFLCQIDVAREQNTTTLQYLNLNKDKIFDCFAFENVSIKSEFYRKNAAISHTTSLKVAPVRFTIEFKPNSAIIGVFHSKE